MLGSDFLKKAMLKHENGLKVKFKKLHPQAVVPKYAKPGDAGLDLTATGITSTEGKIIYNTGLAVEIPEGYVGLIFPRSSIHKKSLRLTNCVGVVDSGYRGEIKFVFDAPTMVRSSFMSPDFEECIYYGNPYKVGDRIGQLIIMPFPQILTEEVEELSETERGAEGFGSTGD